MGGAVSFDVQVPSYALRGTVVVANATVYFPSVPETTPTGDVVSIWSFTTQTGQGFIFLPIVQK